MGKHDFEENSNVRVKGTTTKKKKGKAKKVILIIIAVILIIILGCGAAGYMFINGKLSKMNYEDIDESQIEVNEGVKEQLKGFRTIALFGVDSRENELEKGTRSDCIILATINEKTKDVKLTSVYRDTYLKITGRNLDKVTHAYSYGGATLALSTLNTNLDLNITEFVTVNFDSVAEIVNAVGGVEIDVTSEEIKHINNYIDETSGVTGISSSHVTTPGKQTLDGVQAVSYGRIRYTAGGDYKRTERMRDVLTAIVNKAKKLSISKLNNLVDTIMPKIYTNIKPNEIISLLPQAASFKIGESIGWPYKTKGATISGVWYGPPITLQSNVKQLHQEVFEQSDYEPSSTVKDISAQIVNKTGYSE